MKKPDTLHWTFSALFLALGFVLPFLTMQIPEIGRMLLPMHLPVLLCGFVCGWPYGLLVGFVTPLLRSLFLGMPPMLPMGTASAIAMAFELAAYGFITGLLFTRLRFGRARIFISLLIAMLGGRLVWGLAIWLLYALLMPVPFTLALFWADAFVGAWPGILVQWVLVPLIVLAWENVRVIPLRSR
ncbi:MAG: ECF transporter S component [Clostridia bacterium]|nr:ECF transporter S component [Clostridia bacterium]